MLSLLVSWYVCNHTNPRETYCTDIHTHTYQYRTLSSPLYYFTWDLCCFPLI